jgi:hypothetical protein
LPQTTRNLFPARGTASNADSSVSMAVSPFSSSGRISRIFRLSLMESSISLQKKPAGSSERTTFSFISSGKRSLLHSRSKFSSPVRGNRSTSRKESDPPFARKRATRTQLRFSSSIRIFIRFLSNRELTVSARLSLPAPRRCGWSRLPLPVRVCGRRSPSPLFFPAGRSRWFPDRGSGKSLRCS